MVMMMRRMLFGCMQCWTPRRTDSRYQAADDDDDDSFNDIAGDDDDVYDGVLVLMVL